MVQQVRELTGNNALDHAEKLAQARNWSAAVDICARALKTDPDNTKILDKLGWYLSRAKRYEEAIQVYVDLASRAPKKARWRYMVGYQYYAQGQWADSIEWFDRALELYEAYLVVLYRKGYAHFQLNEKKSAKQAFQKCIGTWRTLQGEEQERQAKHYSGACFQLGKILLASGQTRNAEMILSEAVKYGAPNAHKHYNFGKALLGNGKAREALEQFEKADQIEPAKDYILDRTARALMCLEEYPRAEKVLERIPPRKRKAYVWRDVGRVQLAQGQPTQAIEALIKARKLDPKNHNTQYLLGLAYEGSGEPLAARAAYGRAVALRHRRYGLPFSEAEQRIAALEQQGVVADTESELSKSTHVTNGHIKTYKRDRGYGFISREDGPDLFFHVSDVVNPHAIAIGAETTFQVESSPKGPRAVQVTVA